MNIQQLRYFIAVAKYLHFGAAAKQLYIAQPALSHSIAGLEEELGIQLFNRTSRSVELTPAGNLLMQEVTEIIEKLDEAIEKARRVQFVYNSTLNIGFLGGLSKGAFTESVSSFRSKYPFIYLNLIQTNALTLHEGLLDGNIDLALTRAIDLEPSSQDLKWLRLYEERFCLFMRKDHQLAVQKTVDLSTLKNEPFVMIDQKVSPRIYQYVQQICARRGLKPNIIHTAPTLEVTCTLIRSGLGIAILPACAEEYNKSDLTHINIEGDDLRSDVVLAWRKMNDNNIIPLFLNEIGIKTGALQDISTKFK